MAIESIWNFGFIESCTDIKYFLLKLIVMKQAIIIFVTFCLAASLYAQQRVSETIITVNGNKNLQLSLDGRDYAIISSNISGNKTTISISNLEIRQHTLVVTRTGKNSNRSERISTTFNLRNRFLTSIIKHPEKYQTYG